MKSQPHELRQEQWDAHDGLKPLRSSYVRFHRGNRVSIDGGFDAEDIELISHLMKKYPDQPIAASAARYELRISPPPWPFDANGKS